MVNQALATLESALRTRKLDRTLTSARPPLEGFAGSDAAALAPTGIAALDACLHGGLPRGQLSEIAGPAGSGRTTVVWQLIAAATRRGEIAAFVDTCDRLDITSTVDAGVDLDRLLWIRGDAVCTGTPVSSSGSLMQRAIDRALKALSLVLQAGGFGVVALDLADVPRAALTQLPFTTWLRVQRMVEGSDTACVLLVSEPLARSAGGMTLSLAGQTVWTGDGDRSRRVAGLDVRVRAISPRRRVEADVTVAASAPRGA